MSNFTTYDGMTINNKDRKKQKCWNLISFVTFKEIYKKSAFLKIAAQAYEAGDFLKIFWKVL